MDPFDEADDRLLAAGFAELREDTLAGLRPDGARAAREAYRQARRHRAALVAVAAVASVLALAGGAYAVVGPPTRQPIAGTSTAEPSASANPPLYGRGTSSGAQPGATMGSASGGPGGPVPPGIRVESVTYTSVSTAWALGYAPCLAPRRFPLCPAVLHSGDGGATWVGMPAPGDAAYLGDIRFANSRDGWIVVHEPVVDKDPKAAQPGDAWSVLYATHDGGASWHPVPVPRPYRVEADAGQVWVTTTGPAAAHAVYVAPVGSDAFTRTADGTGGELVVQESAAFVYDGGAGNGLTVLQNGATVHRQLPCPPPGPDPRTVLLAAVTPTALAVVCAGAPGGAAAYTSADAGVTWAAAGTPEVTGTVTALAATGSAMFLAGRGMPVRATRDGGRSWPAVLTAPGADGFGYVGFTDASHGVALTGDPSPVVYRTADGGATWRPYPVG